MGKSEHYIIKDPSYSRHVHEILKSFKNKKVIYLSMSKSYSQFVDFLKESKLPSDNFFFIDCVTRKLECKDETCNCIFVESPRNLTNIGLAITKCLKNADKESVFFLDSLSTMLFYHDKNKISRFSNFLINQLRLKGVGSVFMSIDSDENKDLIQAVNSLVDEVITKQ
ncbi:MAG: hypothetical protein ABII22_03435 [Candidatus Micrarchaeota archaeon]